jgi:hypothetical protein
MPPRTIEEIIARLEHLIAKRDSETAIVGQTLYPLHGFAAHVARWIHGSECNDIRTNIQIIAE